MRVLILLVALVLVGCAKPPTYLACTNINLELDYPTEFIVLDHFNKLWISAKNELKPDYDLQDGYFVYVAELRTDGNDYWASDSSSKINIANKLNRKTLIYTVFYAYQCEVIDDLSYLRSLGLEKNRNKI